MISHQVLTVPGLGGHCYSYVTFVQVLAWHQHKLLFLTDPFTLERGVPDWATSDSSIAWGLGIYSVMSEALSQQRHGYLLVLHYAGYRKKLAKKKLQRGNS